MEKDIHKIRNFVKRQPISGLHMVLCNEIDSNGYKFAKTSETLTKVWEKPEVQSLPGIPGEILGIFVHSDCITNNSSFLQEASSLHLLGNGYKWLMWDWALEDLSSLDLKLDTDMKIISKDYRIIDVYKIKPSSSVISYPLQPPHYHSPQRYNHQGESVKITLISSKTVGMIRVNESFDSLGDRTLHPEAISSLAIVYYLSRPLLEMLNCTFDVVLSKGWGVKTPKGWTEMMGLLERGECEFTLTVSQMRKDRYKYFPFIQKLMIAKVVFAFQELSGFGKWNAVIVPFSYETWVCVASAMIFFGCLLCLFMKATSYPDLPLPTAIEITSSSLSQQGINLETKWISVQLFIFTIITFSFMVFTYYCSQVLNSFLSTSGFSIHSIQQLLDSNYRLGIHNKQYLKNLRQGEITWIGPRDALVNNILDKVEKEDKTHWELPESHPWLKNGKLALLAGDNSLFEYMKAEFTQREICLTQTITKANNLHSVYFAKHSPYVNLLRIKFALMNEVGLLKRATDIFQTKKPECLNQVEAVSISLKGTMLVFSFLIGTYFLSALILIGEKIINLAQKN